MVGRPLEDKFPPRTSEPTNEVLLSVEPVDARERIRPDQLSLRRGEILGFAGLMGAGRTEVARAIFGADPLDSGTVRLGNETLAIRSPIDAIRHGIAYLSEDRKSQWTGGQYDGRRQYHAGHHRCGVEPLRVHPVADEAAVAQRYIDALGIRTPGVQADRAQPVGRQSAEGRHQQMAVSRLAECCSSTNPRAASMSAPNSPSMNCSTGSPRKVLAS